MRRSVDDDVDEVLAGMMRPRRVLAERGDLREGHLLAGVEPNLADLEHLRALGTLAFTNWTGDDERAPRVG